MRKIYLQCKNGHSWKAVGYYDAGFGISSSCEVKWCSSCGAINYKNKIKRPDKAQYHLNGLVQPENKHI